MRSASTIPLHRARPDQQGLSLLEVIIVLAVFLILLVGLAPLLVQGIKEKKLRETREELGAMLEGIRGRSEQGFYGFLSDIGEYPIITDNCSELVTPGCGRSLPPASSGAGGVVYGWNGPYMAVSTEDAHLDAWFKRYQQRLVNAGTGNESWQYLSGGPDRNVATLDDNLTVPNSPARKLGELAVSVRVVFKTGNSFDYSDPAKISFQVFYSNVGVESSQPYLGVDAWNGNAYLFPPPSALGPNPLHYGQHAVRVIIDDPSLGCPVGGCISIGTLFVRGGQQRSVLWVPVPGGAAGDFSVQMLTMSGSGGSGCPSGGAFVDVTNSVTFIAPVRKAFVAAVSDTSGGGEKGEYGSWHLKSVAIGGPGSRTVTVTIRVKNDGSCASFLNGHEFQRVNVLAIH